MLKNNCFGSHDIDLVCRVQELPMVLFHQLHDSYKFKYIEQIMDLWYNRESRFFKGEFFCIQQ